MIVTCEKCDTRFGLDENLIKESGSKVRCSKCRHTFTVYRPAHAEEEATLPGPEEEALGLSQETGQEVPSDAEEESPEISESLDESLDLDLFESEDEDDEGAFSLEDLTLDEAFGSEEEDKESEEEALEEPAASDEEVSLGDLGFEEELAAEEVAERVPGLDVTAESEEEMSLEELTLEEDTAPESVASGAGVGQGEEDVTEQDISFEDLLLEEEPEAAAEPSEEWPASEEESEEEMSLDTLSLEEGETDQDFMEKGLPEEEALEGMGEEAHPVPETSGEELKEAEPPPAAREEPRAKKRISMPLMIVLVVLLVGGGAYAAFTLLKHLDVKIPFLESLTGTEAPETVDPGNRSISLLEQEITSGFVENDAIGTLFVVRGKVRNDYAEPRNFIRVKGVLYLKGGSVAQNRIVYCGNMISDAELEKIDRQSIQKRLGNRFGDNKSNFRVPPGKALPFMVVFYDIPQELGEFSVEVVDSAAG
jgi:predicted Zn finger-like uncharacterized protein